MEKRFGTGRGSASFWASGFSTRGKRFLLGQRIPSPAPNRFQPKALRCQNPSKGSASLLKTTKAAPAEALQPGQRDFLGAKRFILERQKNRSASLPKPPRECFVFGQWIFGGAPNAVQERSASTGPERFPQSEALRFGKLEGKDRKRFAAKTQKRERFDNPATGRAWSRRAGFRLIGLSATKRFVKTKEPAGDLNRFRGEALRFG